MSANENELITRAQRVAGKGVAVDDGFTYSVPAADLKRYRDTIIELMGALIASEVSRGFDANLHRVQLVKMRTEAAMAEMRTAALLEASK